MGISVTVRWRRLLAAGGGALMAVCAWGGELEVGMGLVTDDAWRFGNYSGLGERGLYAIGAADLELAGDDGSVWQLQAADLGLDVRSLNVMGGLPGQYELRLGYDRIPFRGYNYRGSTGGLGSDRETVELGLRFMPRSRFSYDLDYRYTERDGTALTAGSFLTQVAELARPVDDETHHVDAGIRYAAEDWQMRFGYTGSFFVAGAEALRWENPYAPVTPGADQGQLALALDNEFHQLALSGQYRWSPLTQVSGTLAAGRLSQDDSLLAFTLNPGLGTALPRQRANTEVDTLHADLRLTSRWSSPLRTRLSWVYDDRDNDTPIAAWDYVVTDAVATSIARDNLAYGYTRQQLELAADYRFTSRASGSAGYRREDVDRSQAEVEKSGEDEVWARLQLALSDAADLRVRYAWADRNVGSYRALPGMPAENPLLRRYNMADREQNALQLAVDLRPRDNLDLAVSVELRDDDYDESILGLTAARQKILNADGSLVLSRNTVLGVALGYEEINSRQAGSQAFAAPDWSAETDDQTRFVMLSIDLPESLKGWRFRLAGTRAVTDGAIDISQTGFLSPFPDLETRLTRIEFRARYQLRERWSLLFGYLFQDYEVDDWSRDELLPDTLPRVLALGIGWHDYSTHVFSLSASYQLGQMP